MWKIFAISIILIPLIYIGNQGLKISHPKLEIPTLGKLFSPFEGFAQQEESGLPAPHANVYKSIQDIEGEFEVVVDKRGVPHIFVEHENDAYRIQGYLHAYNRLWQMDIMGRYITGRLSEYLGSGTSEIDLLMRRRGMKKATEDMVNEVKQFPETHKSFEAYTQGVNAFMSTINDRNKPIEYKLINAFPEKWSVEKTCMMIKAMTYDLCFRNYDAGATNTLSILGDKEFKYLFPFRYSDEEPIIPKGTKWKNEKIETEPDLGLNIPTNTKRATQIQPSPLIGSNNWVINAEKSATGHPVLCNDPHLSFSFPAIWYELQINTHEYNVHGVSLPGMPGITIGFNEHVAWGVTNVGHDVLDWYEIKWMDKSSGKYVVDGKLKKCIKRIEKIKVKNKPTITDTVWYTDFGPLVYRTDSGHIFENAAMNWLGNSSSAKNQFSTFMRLNKAKSLGDYLNATKQYHVPGQNIVFASKDNDIALRVSGSFPKRRNNDALFLKDGSTTNYTWDGIIAADENPLAINPEQNYLASANQISTDSTYPYPYFGGFDDYRGRIINEKLRGNQKLSIENLKSFQLSDESIYAREGMELFNLYINGSNLKKYQQEYFDLLSNWDLRYKHDQVAPSVFHKWMNNFYNLTWDELTEVHDDVYTPEYWRTINLAIEDPENKYFDIRYTEKKETAKDLAYLAFDEAIDELDSLKNKGEDISWQYVNGVSVRHLMRLKAFGKYNLPVDGSPHSLNAVKSTWGPSWRMIVSLDNKPHGYGVFPGGPSGNPGSKYYDNNLDYWMQGKYYDMKLYKNPGDIIK